MKCMRERKYWKGEEKKYAEYVKRRRRVCVRHVFKKCERTRQGNNIEAILGKKRQSLRVLL